MSGQLWSSLIFFHDICGVMRQKIYNKNIEKRFFFRIITNILIRSDKNGTRHDYVCQKKLNKTLFVEGFLLHESIMNVIVNFITHFRFRQENF